jgi:hypothetical protein
MVKLTFRETKDYVLSILKDNVASFDMDGFSVDARNIKKGVEGRKIEVNPSLTVYATTENVSSYPEGGKIQRRMFIAIACGIKPQASATDAQDAAIELAERVESVIVKNFKGVIAEPEIFSVGETNNASVAAFGFITQYRSSENG